MKKKNKQLCSEKDCFGTVDIDLDIVKMADGTNHPVTLKCWNCRTDEDNKRLKNYRKGQRKKVNKLKKWHQPINLTYKHYMILSSL